MTPAGCTCGDAADHVVARRSTADGKHVLLWSDGSLTWAHGYSIKGAAHPRTDKQRRLALKAGWLVLGEVCIHDAADVPDLVTAARWVAARSGLPGDVRKRVKGAREPKGLTPHWVTYETDRDGRPTVRVWRLPRLIFGGLIVWHERGEYQVLRPCAQAAALRPLRNDDAYENTGFRSRTLRDLQAILPTLRLTEVS